MRKVILAFDGSHFSEGAFEFAKAMNKKNPVLLTGVFLPQFDMANAPGYPVGAKSSVVFIPHVEDEDAAEVIKNIDRFRSLCMANQMEYRVHKDFNDFALPELRKETRFADLLILGSESFYKNFGSGIPNDYLKDALHGVECPVVVVPEKFDFPQTNILAYDGSNTSVYAIKQFAYLFPEMALQSTILVYANEKGQSHLPDQNNIEELAACHFGDLTLFKYNAHPMEYFNSERLESKHPILVCGSFGRTGISVFFHKSFVSDILKDHCIPVFIAHHK